jgi:hypothetical protein
MPDTVNDALTVLHKDIDTHHLDKFIQDLGKDLQKFTKDQDHAKLLQEAHDALVAAHIIPDLKITGVSNNELQLEDGDAKKSLLDSHGKLRNEQGQITSDANHEATYEYENGQLSKVTSGSLVFEKRADGWYDEDGKKFPKGQEPKVNQQTGDLTFKRQGDDDQTTWPYNGGEVFRDKTGRITETKTDGQPSETRDFTYDDKGNLKQVDYSKGDYVDRWVKQDDGTWQNQKKNGENYEDTDRTLDKIGVTKEGDYYEVSDDKRRIFHTGGKDETVPDTGSDSDTQPDHKKANPDWTSQRQKNQADIEKDIRDNDEHVVKYGDTLWDIAKQSAKVHEDKEPSNAEIAAEMARLIKKNKIKNPDNVPIGTKIDTSEDS